MVTIINGVQILCHTGSTYFISYNKSNQHAKELFHYITFAFLLSYFDFLSIIDNHKSLSWDASHWKGYITYNNKVKEIKNIYIYLILCAEQI